MNAIDRPLDLLNQAKGKTVLVTLRNSREDISGTLLAFDIHINLVLKDVLDAGDEKVGLLFIRGAEVLCISPVPDEE